MGLRVSLIINLACLMLACIVSFVLFTPLASHHSNYDGQCLLYSTGQWLNPNLTGVSLFHIDSWGAVSNCNYGVFVGVTSMLLSMMYIVAECYGLYVSADPPFTLLLVATLVNSLLTFLAFVAACVISVGFQVICDDLTLLPGAKSTKCSDYGVMTKMFLDSPKLSSDVKQQFFYTNLMTSEVGSWFTFVFWLIVTACFAFRLRMLNAEEDFLTTLNRERDRLTSSNRAPPASGPDYDQI